MKTLSGISCGVWFLVSIAAAQAPLQLERALRAELQVLDIRRCYNDRMITSDEAHTRITLTNVSNMPLAIWPAEMPLSRSRLWEASADRQPNGLVWDLSGHATSSSAPPEELATLWPGEAVASNGVLHLATLRPGAERRPALLQRMPHVMSVTVVVRIAVYEKDGQPVSSARPYEFETSRAYVDLSAPMAIEFCR